MTVDLPDYLAFGEPARLIPVASGSQKERCAASVLLAGLGIVAPFAEAVLSTINKSLGSRTKISAYTEVTFKNQPSEANCRPDGLLVLDTSRSEWRAVIEAKIGTAKIRPEQLALYCQLAVANGIDAIITISNELTEFADHPPYEIPSELVGKVEVYHWSWMKLITLGTILLSGDDENFDPEQHIILKEMLRYFSHENTDVRGFHQMNSEWPALLERVHSGADIKKDQAQVLKAVSAWHQEQSDLCLILSRKLRVPVTLRMKKYFRDNQAIRVKSDAEEFANTKVLRAVFDVPNLAAPIEVTADALKRNIVCQMCVQAPEDKKRYESRLNWLLRQLPDELSDAVGIHVRWKNGGSSFGWMSDLRANPESADIGRAGALPKAFEVCAVTDLGKKFSGTKNFIDVLETALPQFYDNVARHIRAWQPGPAAGPVEPSETLAETVAGLPEPKTSRQVVKRGEVSNGRYVMFEDGSVEVETPNGTRRFKDVQELLAHAKSGSHAK